MAPNLFKLEMAMEYTQSQSRASQRTASLDTELSAVQIRQMLSKARILTVALIGPPGAGKTALLEATARQLRGMTGVAIVVANPAAQRDAERLTRYCDHVEVVNSAAPTAEEIHTAVQHLQLKGIQIVFIESLGGIFGVPDFGQDVTVAVLAVSGGDDKAAEYANLVSHSDVVILTKSELQRHVMFDRGVMRLDVHRINPIAEFLEVSAFENTGLKKWLSWLDRQHEKKDPSYEPSRLPPPLPEWFFG